MEIQGYAVSSFSLIMILKWMHDLLYFVILMNLLRTSDLGDCIPNTEIK